MIKRGSLGVYGLLTIVVLWGAFALRLWHLEAESIWHDEAWSIRAIHSPFGTPDDNTPYVYYATLHLLWKSGIGNSPFALRFGSVLIGLLTVALALRVGRRWLGHDASLFFGLLAATSPLLWEYAQEVRAYVAVPLLALLLLDMADRLSKKPPQTPIPSRLWLSLFCIEIISLYTHNLMVPVLVWLNLAVGMVWLWRRDVVKILRWGMLQIGVGLAYIPWVLTQSPSGTTLNTAPEPSFELAKEIWYSYFLPALPQVQEMDSSLVLNLAAGVLILLSLALLIRQAQPRTWLLLSHALLIPVFSTALLIAAEIDFHPRYYIAAVPGTFLLIVVGSAALWPQEKTQSLFPRVTYLMLSAGAIALSWYSLNEINSTRAYQHDDFAGLAAYYATLPAEAVIVIPFDDEPALEYYFAAEYDIQAQFLNIPLHADVETALRYLNEIDSTQAQHVEFLTWFQLPADIRGMYPCILAASSDQVQAPQRYFGLSTQGFNLIQAPQFQAMAVSQAFGAANLESLKTMSAPGGLCIQSQWEIQDTRESPLSVALSLRNRDDGWQIVREDRVIRDREQIATLAQGAKGQAFVWLQLPPASPRQAYPLRLTLYDDTQPSGYDVVINNQIMGKNLRLPQMVIAEGIAINENTPQSQLLDDNSTDQRIDSGHQLDLTLLVARPISEIVLRGNDWELRQSIEFQNTGNIQRLWPSFVIPPDASGSATLLAGDEVLAVYQINTIERLWESPNFENEANAAFGDFAELVGFTVDSPLDITLIWRSQQSTEIPYTVFVQVLAPDNRIIAQNDSQPAQNQRPSTGWVADEYIVDNHRLRLGVDNYEGSATVIVGFYDAQTFDRVTTSEGSDFYVLPIDLVIE